MRNRPDPLAAAKTDTREIARALGPDESASLDREPGPGDEWPDPIVLAAGLEVRYLDASADVTLFDAHGADSIT